MKKIFNLKRERCRLTVLLISLPTSVFVTDSAYGQGLRNFAKNAAGDCACPVIKYVDQPPQFYPPLAGDISYVTFQKFNLWKFPNDVTSFDLLFVKDGWSSGSGEDFFKELTIVSYQSPIKLVHPDGTFTMNLTPCPDEHHNYSLPVSISYKPSIADELRDFDYTKFNNTTLGYVHLFMQLSRKRPDQMIRIAFKEWARNYGQKGVNEAIDKINEAYQTGIPRVTEENYSDSLMIAGVLDSLVSKKLRQERVFTTGFILSEPGVHAPTYEERNRLEMLFYRYMNQSEFELFNPRNFLPQFSVKLKSSEAILEISAKILSPAAGRPENLLLNAGVRIWFCNDLINNERMMRIDCAADACLQPSVVTGTTMGIDFDNIILYPEQLQTMGGYDCTPYPQFAKDTTAYKAYYPKKWTLYDTVFTHFTGLVIQNARFRLPYGKTQLQLKGQNVIINNLVIGGCLVADIAPDNAAAVLLNQADGTSKTITIADLLTVLRKSGVKDFITQTDKKQFRIYFKKLAG